MRALFPAFLTALTTDRVGRVTAAQPLVISSAAIGQSVADRDYFEAAKLHRSYVSNAFVGRGIGQDRLVAVSAPLLIDGAFTGIVEGSIKVEDLTALRSSALRSRGQEMLVVDRQGQVIFASEGLPFTFQQRVRVPALAAGPGRDGTGPAVIDRTVFGSAGAWVSWAALKSGWHVAVFESRQPILAEIWSRAAQIGGVLMLATMLALMVARREIHKLARAAEFTLEQLRAIAAGESDPEAAMHVPVELRPVTHEVIHLASQLQLANSDLAQALASEARLSAHLKQVNDRLEATVRERTQDLENANRELLVLSQTDPLTGALNVRGLEATRSRWTNSHGILSLPLALVMLDVDHFKAFNDRYGHPAGDQVLRRIAGVGRAALRASDDRLARIGGEEFLVVLPNATELVGEQFAERLRQAVFDLQIPHADAVEGRVTISAGVALGEVGQRFVEVAQVADDTLYVAKHRGRNQVAVAGSAPP